MPRRARLAHRDEIGLADAVMHMHIGPALVGDGRFPAELGPPLGQIVVPDEQVDLAGLDGDVVIWSGDPLAVESRALHVFISGRAALEPTSSDDPTPRVVGRWERFGRTNWVG